MATTNFTSYQTVITATWLNDVDAVVWDILNGPTTLAEFWTAIGPTPGAIGGTTPAAGTFTTLTTTGAVDIGNGGSSFTIAGSALSGKAAVHADDATDILGFVIERHENTTAAFGAHFVGARTRGTEAAETIVQSGDLLTRLLALGYDGVDYGTAGEIAIEVDGSPGVGDMPGRIVFRVSPDGSETMAEAMRINNAKQILLQSVNDATAPTLAFGDGDTGFYETADDSMSVAISGLEKFEWTGNEYRAVTTGSGAIVNETPSATNPTLIPASGDYDTGIGRAAADQLSLVAGGLEGARVEDPADLAATETSLWIYDLDNAAIQQVTVGAADSGGAGFKVLRIPN